MGANACSCECGDGYVFSNGVNCTEVFNCDSVEANDCDSNAACNHDGPGRHSCSCNQGYTGDGTSCADFNGCEDSPCFEHPDVQCHDTPAALDGGGASSFRCDECPSGWSGDGVECSDIDDCSTSP